MENLGKIGTIPRPWFESTTMSDPQPARISFDRLRERTDELELLISGLSMLALFSLPSWLMDSYQYANVQLPLVMLSAAAIALPMTVLFCYLLAGCFALHLGIRGYWVGLIGLKSAFPEGVRWERTVAMGPWRKQWLQRTLPDIDASIAVADRAASALFSGIIFVGSSLVWLGILGTLTLVVAALIGSRVGGINSAINLAMFGFSCAMLGSVLMLCVLDRVFVQHFPRLQGYRVFRFLLHSCAWVVGLYFPSRWLTPMRLQLQTNTRPRLFLLLFISCITILPLQAVRQVQANTGFDWFGTYGYLHSSDLEEGFRSAHYESQRVDRNRLRPVPLIPAPMVQGDWLPVFLPFLPLRDDPLMAELCPERASFSPEQLPDRGTDAIDQVLQSRSLATQACLARFWSLKLNGRDIDLDRFLPSERADLGFRGLQGYIDLRDEVQGPQRLEVIFQPNARTSPLIDNSISGRRRFVIPFVWNPQQ